MAHTNVSLNPLMLAYSSNNRLSVFICIVRISIDYAFTVFFKLFLRVSQILNYITGIIIS